MPSSLIFVYGLLQPGFHPPKSIMRSWPDTIAGKLYDLGPYPGANEIGHTDETFAGWVLEIDDAELADLDEFEDVEGSGLFQRRRATTTGNHQVWIYEYTGPAPAAPNIPRWPALKSPAPPID